MRLSEESFHSAISSHIGRRFCFAPVFYIDRYLLGMVSGQSVVMLPGETWHTTDMGIAAFEADRLNRRMGVDWSECSDIIRELERVPRTQGSYR